MFENIKCLVIKAIATLMVLVAFGGSVWAQSYASALTAEEVQSKVVGNILVDKEVAYLIAPDSQLFFVNRETGGVKPGLWFFGKTKVHYKNNVTEDSLCLAVGQTRKESIQEIWCMRFFKDSDGLKNNYDTVMDPCLSSSNGMMECKFSRSVENNYHVLSNVADVKVQQANLKDNGDGTVLDEKTGLQWAQCSLGQQNFMGLKCFTHAKKISGMQDALARVKSFNESGGLGGYRDWRIPSIDELRSIVYCSNGKKTPLRKGDRCDYPLPPGMSEEFRQPAMDPIFVGDSWGYLTDTEGDDDSIWMVNFSSGYANAVSSNRLKNIYLRLVRGGRK